MAIQINSISSINNKRIQPNRTAIRKLLTKANIKLLTKTNYKLLTKTKHELLTQAIRKLLTKKNRKLLYKANCKLLTKANRKPLTKANRNRPCRTKIQGTISTEIPMAPSRKVMEVAMAAYQTAFLQSQPALQLKNLLKPRNCYHQKANISS